jgi:hypothetical protein
MPMPTSSKIDEYYADDDIGSCLNGEVSTSNLYDDSTYETCNFSKSSASCMQPVIPKSSAESNFNNHDASIRRSPPHTPSQKNNSISNDGINTSQACTSLHNDIVASPNSVLHQVPERIFHIQMPGNAVPGMQLIVENPMTKESLVITIPNGVAPGGKLAVRF